MTTMNLMNTISVTLISVASKAVIETAYFDGTGISFDDAGIANYRLIEQDKKNFFELWILWNNGDFVRYEGELSEEAQSVANQLFDVAWVEEFEVKEEVVYQEDRFGVPCEVLRYEEFYPSFAGKDFETEVLIADPSVPF